VPRAFFGAEDSRGDRITSGFLAGCAIGFDFRRIGRDFRGGDAGTDRASCVTATRATSASLPSTALASLAAMTMSIASRIASVFNRLASSNARIRLSLSHNAACASPSLVFISSCFVGSRSGIQYPHSPTKSCIGRAISSNNRTLSRNTTSLLRISTISNSRNRRRRRPTCTVVSPMWSAICCWVNGNP